MSRGGAIRQGTPRIVKPLRGGWGTVAPGRSVAPDGIAPDALPHVFSRFWQGKSEAGAGLGLGLYICEKIVAAHMGRIWVESDLGKGTTFRFVLPVHPPAE